MMARNLQKRMETMNRHDAYTAMLDRHRSVIWAMCWAHSRGRWDDCCDLVQEVSIALWENYDKLRPGSSPREERAWVRWQVRSVFDQQRRRRQPEPQPITDMIASSLAAEDSRQRQEDIDEMMASLSPDEQRMVRLQLEGYQANEIASVMGLKRDAVYQRMHRIVVKARRAMVFVLMLFFVSTVAIAVVPQWRQTVFGTSVGSGQSTVDSAMQNDRHQPPAASYQLPAELPSETDTVEALRLWIPPEPEPYLEAASSLPDTGQPMLPQVHRIQPVIIMSAHRLIVSGAEGEMVSIYNGAGKLVASQRCNGLCYFNITRSRDVGDYILQIGDDPANRYRF